MTPFSSYYIIFEPDALEAIAAKALKKDTGARALRAIIEDFMLDIMYEIPKDDNIGRVRITRAYVEHTGGPVIELRGLELSSENDHSNFCNVNFKEIKDTMVFYLQMMLKEIETRAPGHEAICQDLMEILIVLFGRQTNFSTILTPANKKASHLCDSVRRYLDQNCEEDITLEQLARFSHVNKYYLVHAFTDEYGISPINFLKCL